MSIPISSALELAQRHPVQFLAEHIFPGLSVNDFKFGQGTSGNHGAHMISQHVVMPAHTRDGGSHPVAEVKEMVIHLNCIVNPSALQNDDIRIRVEQFHLTVRSLASQRRIDVHGPSIISANSSIHMSVKKGWGRADNLRALAQEVGDDTDQTLRSEVRSGQGYDGTYIRSLVKEFRVRVKQRIQEYLGGNVTVHWDGDATFPLR